MGQLVVYVEPDTDDRRIEVRFKFPIVGDQLEYLDPTQQSKGYEVIEGVDTHSIRGAFSSKHDGLKKRPVTGG